MVYKSNKFILGKQSVCSSTMNLLRALTEAGKMFESIKHFKAKVVERSSC